MHELSRMAYLDALGIDSYVSRAQLPGAAATRRLAIVTAPSSQQLPAGVIPEPLRSRTSLVAQPARPAKVSVQASASSQQGEPVPRFSLTAIVAGDWLWLEELAGPLTTDQVRLVQSMAQALLLCHAIARG